MATAGLQFVQSPRYCADCLSASLCCSAHPKTTISLFFLKSVFVRVQVKWRQCCWLVSLHFAPSLYDINFPIYLWVSPFIHYQHLFFFWGWHGGWPWVKMWGISWTGRQSISTKQPLTFTCGGEFKISTPKRKPPFVGGFKKMISTDHCTTKTHKC